MKRKNVFFLISGILVLSAIVMLIIGLTQDGLEILMYAGLARINHKLRSETQREVLGYKAGAGFRCELYEYIL